MTEDEEYFCFELLTATRNCIILLIICVCFGIVMKFKRLRRMRETFRQIKAANQVYKCPECQTDIKAINQKFSNNKQKAKNFLKKASSLLNCLKYKKCQDKTEKEFAMISQDKKENAMNEKFQNKTENKGDSQTLPYPTLFMTERYCPNEKVPGSTRVVSYECVIPKGTQIQQFLITANLLKGNMWKTGFIKLSEDEVNRIILPKEEEQLVAMIGKKSEIMLFRKRMRKTGLKYKEIATLDSVTLSLHHNPKASEVPKEVYDAIEKTSNILNKCHQKEDESAMKKAAENVKEDAGELIDVLVLE